MDENQTNDMLDYEPDILTLEDEEGEEHTFEVIDASDFGEHRYLALVPYSANPAEALEEDTELLIMRVGEENGEEYLDLVEDEDELYEVGQHFLSRLSEVYNIDLEDLESELLD